MYLTGNRCNFIDLEVFCITYTIVYSSRTGNTKLLADGIRSVLPTESCVYFGPVSGAEREVAQADVVFAGFWTDKGSCDEEMAGFLSGIVGKDVFLFGTAGFGGSREYFFENSGECWKIFGWVMPPGRNVHVPGTNAPGGAETI